MDLAKKASTDYSKTLDRLVFKLALLPGLWLIFYLLVVKPEATLKEFQFQRNKMYGVFIILSLIIAVSIMSRKGLYVLRNSSRNEEKDNFSSYLIPNVIQGVILVSFSYAIAGLIKTLFNLP